MEKFYRAVVRHPWLVITAFLLLAAFSLVCWPLVEVNYDITAYLPPESPSTAAIEEMQGEFTGGIPNARVLVRDVSIPQALSMKERLKAVDGVSEVTWLDDTASLAQPIEMLEDDVVSPYYQDGHALYSVVIASDKLVDSVAAIREVIGPGNAVIGGAASTADATTSTLSQVAVIAAISVAFVLVVLLLTTHSWLEPLLVLGSLGVAVLINNGTNIIFGEISFVSNAAGSILQLAVSLDYSVFLIHRYEECRRVCANDQEAMVQALCKSTASILSSGLTTVIGFLALCLMQFRIGPDLGLVLGKGVAISLITVFLFSPVLILRCSKAMDRTRHRSLMPDFHGLGRMITKVMLPMAAVFALVALPSYLASVSNKYYYGASHIFGPETPLGADTLAVEEIFGQNDAYVLMVPRGNTAREAKLSQAIQQEDGVLSVVSFVDQAGATIPVEFLDESLSSLIVSENYSRMVINVGVETEGERSFALIQRLRDIAQSFYPDAWYLAGEGVSTLDLKDTITEDNGKVNLIAIGAVFVVLLLSFRSLSLPVILVLSIETAIWINMAIPYFSGQVIFYIAYLIISSIQLGATVDYAILFTDRYMEYRQTLPKKEAIVETVRVVTVSILTSGLTMTVVGFLMGYIATHGLLSQMGIFLGVGTLMSMVIVLFVLPGLLYVLDGVIRRTTRLPKGETL